jgi:hypothetical protein
MKRAIAAAAKARGSVLLVGILALILFSPAIAQANAARVTQGDARAIFEAFPTGGWAVVLNNGTLEGAPADFLPGSLARIYAMAPGDGRHYCSLNWHLISVTANEGNTVGQSRTNTEIRDFLSQIELDFLLDGVPLDTMRTAIKRTLNPERGFVEAFFVSEGQVMAPEDLSVGQHSLQFTGHRPGQPPNVFPRITFFIDAPGVGTCV